MILVLWDIDRTLLYTGDIDRRVYRETFTDVVGRPPTALPARGTGVTMPLAVRELLAANRVPPADSEALANRIVEQLPQRLQQYRELLATNGVVLPGAAEALSAVHRDGRFVPTVVTGNLRGSAEAKLDALGLISYLDITIGGYASDNSHRPALVRIAQDRAEAVHGIHFDRENTVIVGDSLEDVRTGLEGGARVIAVASGTTDASQLRDAGANHVLPDLTDTDGLLRILATQVHETQ
ncbi:haloacid dehalogenase-like hydrolase (plasmid) [Streptomyces avidinii]|uniref:HAD family hydrolase n=1 Tax=Streptomyces avidinii TaxID=1895 RepID=UPI002F90DC07|nr:haloacid dehalogenase-like hydrolase [Streptomyces avidinii]